MRMLSKITRAPALLHSCSRGAFTEKDQVTGEYKAASEKSEVERFKDSQKIEIEHCYMAYQTGVDRITSCVSHRVS